MHADSVIEEHALQGHQWIARTKAADNFPEMFWQKNAIMQDHQIAVSGLQRETVFLLADLHRRGSDVLTHDADFVEIGEVTSRRAAQQYLLVRDVNFQNALHDGIENGGVAWTDRDAEGPAVEIVVRFRSQPGYFLVSDRVGRTRNDLERSREVITIQITLDRRVFDDRYFFANIQKVRTVPQQQGCQR